MQLGITLMAGTKTRTPWMMRVADNAVMTFEIIDKSGGSETVTVKLLEKDLEDTGNGTENTTGTNWNPNNSNVGFHTRKYTGLKEQIRFEIEVGAVGENAFGVLYRILPPTWFNTATA